MTNENKNLLVKLNEYVTELDGLVARMESCAFPFTDVISVYSEVSSQLRGIIRDSGSDL